MKCWFITDLLNPYKFKNVPDFSIFNKYFNRWAISSCYLQLLLKVSRLFL